MTLRQIISGGQTGADRGALIAAKRKGLQTGGWMPKGFRAEDGNHPEFAALYGMREDASREYPPRTARNVQAADATLRCATTWDSPGEKLTLKLCRQYHKPVLDVDLHWPPPLIAVQFLVAIDAGVLNVAGNRESTSPGLQRWVEAYVAEIIDLLEEVV